MPENKPQSILGKEKKTPEQLKKYFIDKLVECATEFTQFKKELNENANIDQVKRMYDDLIHKWKNFIKDDSLQQALSSLPPDSKQIVQEVKRMADDPNFFSQEWSYKARRIQEQRALNPNINPRF